MIKLGLVYRGLELQHQQGLPWTATSGLLAQVVPYLCHDVFSTLSGVSRLMCLGIKINPLQQSILASIMFRLSLIQCGLGLRHWQGLPWTGRSDLLAQNSL